MNYETLEATKSKGALEAGTYMLTLLFATVKAKLVVASVSSLITLSMAAAALNAITFGFYAYRANVIERIHAQERVPSVEGVDQHLKYTDSQVTAIEEGAKDREKRLRDLESDVKAIYTGCSVGFTILITLNGFNLLVIPRRNEASKSEMITLGNLRVSKAGGERLAAEDIENLEYYSDYLKEIIRKKRRESDLGNR